LSKKYSITHFFFVGLLINLLIPNLLAQDTLSIERKDRIYRESNAMEAPVHYSCTDSIYADFETQIVTLYGAAEVKYQTITMTADRIEMDIEKKEVYAIYTLDEDSNRVGIPKFTDGPESFTAASIRYNFETEKGYIEELKTQQDEMFLQMGIAKRHQNEEIHFTQGKFTTCELDDPHFHFQLSKAVMVPNERIATGPVNLYVKGIPTPLGLPFSVIPTKDREESGFMFPMVTPVSQYGFGFQDLGYYFPLEKSEQIQTTLYGSLYSSGTFELRNQTDYKKRYKFTGNLNLGYSSFRQRFPNDSSRQQKITVRWAHSQEAKANPYWKFNSQVNFQSDNNGQTTLDPLSNQYFQNNFNSDINLVRSFPGKPVTIGLKTALKQNSASNNIDVDLPTLNINVNRFFPFRGLGSGVGKERFYEKIGFRYSLESKNRALIHDSLVEQRRFDLMQNQFRNGVSQSMSMNYPMQLFNKILTLNTTASYNLRTNFQSIDKRYDSSEDTIVTNTLQGAGFSQDFSLNADLSTNLYAYYSFIGSPEMKMRHVMTPRLSFRYQPDLSSYVTDTLGPTNTVVNYSPYDESLYREGIGREQGIISFSLNNTFELKRPNRKDTTEEFSKIRIIDALSLSGNYDIFKDSMQLSDISLQLRVSPLTGLSFVSRGSVTPYAWNENGLEFNEYAYRNDQGAGRFKSVNLSTTYTFASKKSKGKIEKNQEDMADHWGADFQYYSMNPHEIIDFDIPWKINLTHTWFFNLNTTADAFKERNYSQSQNVVVSGDVSFTERWKLGFNSSYDFEQGQLTQTRLSLNRDMHCWQLAFYWTPVGGQQSFLVRFNATSALFQSAKLELRKPPEFL
jgi:lipopolysaccharide assembly outer membrane protein LptD (OstA)